MNIRTQIAFSLSAVLFGALLTPLAWAAEPEAPPAQDPPAAVTDGAAELANQAVGWAERETLTGDWGGGRTWLKDHGITIAPRVTQFYQGLTAGDGDNDFEYGGKADLALNADLSKLGLWKGLSMTVHVENNFGDAVTGAGGTLIPPNTALLFPGMEGSDAFDVSSFYFTQFLSKSAMVMFGKINMMDVAAKTPFKGGAGIDSFWNLTFVAPPSGLVPPYLFGALLNVRTKSATYGLWIYDPNSVVNESSFNDRFADGITVRGSVDFPVTIGGLSGRQGFVALYSTESGNDLSDIGDNGLPPFPGTVDVKNSRYYFAYSFDQLLYQPIAGSKEGFGLFGQVSISDGNPSRLYFSALFGIGGTGLLIPGRSQDNWGIGYYYDGPSRDLQDALEPVLKVRDEQGMEVFYNFAVRRWLTVGLDLQVINPSLGEDTVVIPGVRVVTRF